METNLMFNKKNQNNQYSTFSEDTVIIITDVQVSRTSNSAYSVRFVAKLRDSNGFEIRIPFNEGWTIPLVLTNSANDGKTSLTHFIFGPNSVEAFVTIDFTEVSGTGSFDVDIAPSAISAGVDSITSYTVPSAEFTGMLSLDSLSGGSLTVTTNIFIKATILSPSKFVEVQSKIVDNNFVINLSELELRDASIFFEVNDGVVDVDFTAVMSGNGSVDGVVMSSGTTFSRFDMHKARIGTTSLSKEWKRLRSCSLVDLRNNQGGDGLFGLLGGLATSTGTVQGNRIVVNSSDLTNSAYANAIAALQADGWIIASTL